MRNPFFLESHFFEKSKIFFLKNPKIFFLEILNFLRNQKFFCEILNFFWKIQFFFEKSKIFLRNPKFFREIQIFFQYFFLPNIGFMTLFSPFLFLYYVYVCIWAFYGCSENNPLRGRSLARMHLYVSTSSCGNYPDSLFRGTFIFA